MIRLFQWLFLGHCHKWKTIAEAQIVRSDGKSHVGQSYTMRCEECGKITHYNSWCI
jgi:RNase P subunit RPR2